MKKLYKVLFLYATISLSGSYCLNASDSYTPVPRWSTLYYHTKVRNFTSEDAQALLSYVYNDRETPGKEVTIQFLCYVLKDCDKGDHVRDHLSLGNEQRDLQRLSNAKTLFDATNENDLVQTLIRVMTHQKTRIFVNWNGTAGKNNGPAIEVWLSTKERVGFEINTTRESHLTSPLSNVKLIIKLPPLNNPSPVCTLLNAFPVSNRKIEQITQFKVNPNQPERN